MFKKLVLTSLHTFPQWSLWIYNNNHNVSGTVLGALRA